MCFFWVQFTYYILSLPSFAGSPKSSKFRDIVSYNFNVCFLHEKSNIKHKEQIIQMLKTGRNKCLVEVKEMIFE